MSDRTKISWTDSTQNFWRGCTKISAGCANCYAETLVTTRLGGEWGTGKPRIKLKDFGKPISWNKKPWVCEKCGTVRANRGHQDSITFCPCGAPNDQSHRRRVFSLSLGDIGDPEVPLELFDEAMVVVDKCRDLTWQLLTKRPDDFLERWQKVCRHWGRTDFSLPNNVWMGVSVENQEMANLRIPQLLKIPAKTRFLSAEPLLGPINLIGNQECEVWPWCESVANGEGINWVIVGGESGHNARPCNIEWIRSIKYQCASVGVACFVKQLGKSYYHDSLGSRQHVFPNDSKGGDMEEWPTDLRVREFPHPD